MTCLPQDVYPVLELEKEEDTIFEATKNLPLEIDVEDTGSLFGLGEKLATNKYDIIHISGHADIGKNGEPFFLMEDGEGLPDKVTPEQLWEKLSLNMPRLVFLSGCRTGEAPDHVAAISFAHSLVAGRVPCVLGWSLPVSDAGARFAAEKLYFEFSRGENIPDALRRSRYELSKHFPDWSLLRLFSDGTPLEIPLVKREQKKKLTLRERQYIFLENSQVKVLKKGFIGRRRQIQQGLRCLRRDDNKIGLLLHGTGGLGKSCLAGKYCEHYKDHTLIVVHGELKDSVFLEALKDGFMRGNDTQGAQILELKEELPDKIKRLCYSAFLGGKYLILLDDFEKNLVGEKEGNPVVRIEAVPILETLLKYLPNSGKMTQLIITSRYTFSLTFGGIDQVREKLGSIGLTSFREADERKKVSELDNINNYPDPEIRKSLIEAGRGNPRLMEYLNTLVGEVKGLDIPLLLSRVKDKQVEFVQGLVLQQLLEAQPEDFRTFLSRCAVYRLPVLKAGIGLLFGDLKDWESQIEKAVRLSLLEKDSSRLDIRYWVTPLLREDIFGKLEDEEKKKCHKIAISYYQENLSKVYEPVSSAELIQHALSAGLLEIAIEESGGRLLPYLRESLAYMEALESGEHIRSRIVEPKRDEKFSKFMYELGYLHDDMGNARKAIEYYEQALAIGTEVYGEKHPEVATYLNNIGAAWDSLGDSKKAMAYFEQALEIDTEVYGERHPKVATYFNNIGLAWGNLGESKKAIAYFEQALAIDKQVYGDRHPKVAISFSNIGVAWNALGDPKKSIAYYEQALAIDKEVYGDRHPNVAIRLSNIGIAFDALGDSKKAIVYYEQALEIDKEVYGDRHPDVASYLNNIGIACDALGDSKKALTYYEQALKINKEVYGDRHPNVATYLGNIGMAWYNLGDSKKAIAYFEQALAIDKEVYGERHPNVAIRLGNIGVTWHNLGDSKKAIEYYEQALAIVKEVYGEKHPKVATYFNNIGAAWKALGDFQRAKEYFQHAYDMFREFYGDGHPHTRDAKKWLDDTLKK